MTETSRIIVGVDGSESGQRALCWAVGEAARRNEAGQPTTVQAIIAWRDEFLAGPMGTAVDLPSLAALAERTLSAAVAQARAAYPQVSVASQVVHGTAADVLGRASDDADLLVVGSHGHRLLYAAALGSVAEACVRTATCPVVIMPAARSSSTSPEREILVATE